MFPPLAIVNAVMNTLRPCFQFLGGIYPEAEVLGHIVVFNLLKNCQITFPTRRTLFFMSKTLKSLRGGVYEENCQIFSL